MKNVYRYNDTATVKWETFHAGLFGDALAEAREAIESYGEVKHEEAIYTGGKLKPERDDLGTNIDALRAIVFIYEVERDDLWDLHEAVSDLHGDLNALVSSPLIIDKAKVTATTILNHKLVRP